MLADPSQCYVTTIYSGLINNLGDNVFPENCTPSPDFASFTDFGVRVIFVISFWIVIGQLSA